MREQALPVREISRQALYRLPFYLSYLKKAEAEGYCIYPRRRWRQTLTLMRFK